jgi:hypothetical protein
MVSSRGTQIIAIKAKQVHIKLADDKARRGGVFKVGQRVKTC